MARRILRIANTQMTKIATATTAGTIPELVVEGDRCAVVDVEAEKVVALTSVLVAAFIGAVGASVSTSWASSLAGDFGDK